MESKIVVVNGSSNGIGCEIARVFLGLGYHVHGIDMDNSPQFDDHSSYIHHIVDVSRCEDLPDIDNVEFLINVSNVHDTYRDIDINLKGTINCTEKYGMQPHIRAVVNIASASAHNGAELAEYVASNGGIIAYTKNVAKRIAVYGATCNSISPGGVITECNDAVMNDPEKWDKIMSMTPLKKWASTAEIAYWAYFIAVINKSATAQDFIVDNGEMFNHTFVW